MASTFVKVRDFIESIAVIGAKYIFPILATICPVLKLPAWIGVIAGSVIPQLMAIAEQDFPAPGSGPMKKAKVLDAADKIMAVLESTFTGGAAGSFAKLKPTIEALIDQTVTAVNELAPAIIADDLPTIGTIAPLSGQ